MFPFFLCCCIKKVEPTHGTPPAAGIASFRSTTTKHNIPSKAKAVKWILVVVVVYVLMVCFILFYLKFPVLRQDTYPDILPPCLFYSTRHTNYSDTDK